MHIPFTKAHGARNDFLLTWRESIPASLDLARAALTICDRYTGIGADGWLLVSSSGKESAKGADAAIQLLNSDGSPSEISGNGTRCAAAFLIDAGKAKDHVAISTGAGLKHLRLLARRGRHFSFEMNMGRAIIEDLHARILDHDCVILNVGNPQCAVLVDNFDFDWRTPGAALERHPRFPNRTNVSFIRVIDTHTLDVRFFERGAGETMSSGTGSTGAAAAALARGLVATRRPTRIALAGRRHPAHRPRGNCRHRRVLLR
jgi:diaminopimelate epimerase